MARASEQFQQSDIALWGVIALVCGAIAVLSANVSAALPQRLLSGLHQTRIEGGSVDQLRFQVANLRDETLRLKNENVSLQTRFALREQAEQDAIERIGALEVTMPRIIEALPDGAAIDPSTTAAIGDAGGESFEADGGTVTVQQRPMMPPASDLNQPLPPQVAETAPLAVPDANAFGVAIGPALAEGEAVASWDDITNKFGALLLGMAPLLASDPASDSSRILVGPIVALSDATALCSRLERLSVACQPMPFTGTPLSF